MKVKDILNYTPDAINKMGKNELLKLAKASQKAIKDAKYRMKEAGLTDVAGYRAMVSQGNISAKKSMNAGELKREIMKARIQLNYSTGNVSKARAAKATFTEAMAARFGGELTEDESQAMWTVIDRIAKTNPALLEVSNVKYIPKEAQQRMYSIMKDTPRQSDESQDDYINRLTSTSYERLTADYEERQYAEEVEDEDFSDLFSF